MNKDYHEPILDDDALVYGDYWYVVDGKVCMPKFVGFVHAMKKALKAKKIQRCDMKARGLKKGIE